MLSTNTAQRSASSRVIDLTSSLPDITANYVHDSEHFQLPSDLFEDILYEALNNLIDEFAQNPDKYLQPHHQTQIDRIAEQYLNS